MIILVLKQVKTNKGKKFTLIEEKFKLFISLPRLDILLSLMNLEFSLVAFLIRI
jgi:hypothetical protein